MTKIAVHSEDIDGIACAALFLIVFPDAEVKFLTVQQAESTVEEFDYVADLPKCSSCRVNIDHHKSNYERLKKTNNLSENDLVDPSSPSAAMLVMKYFKLNNNPIAREIVELANNADKGIFTEKTRLLDKVIKLHLNDQSYLRKLASILAKYGSKFHLNDWLKSELDETAKMISKYDKILNKAISDILSRKINYVIFDVRDFPFFVAKDFAQIYAIRNGCVAISIYKDPITNKPRCSIRVNKDCKFSASKLAEKLGGGGHEKAAGAIIEDFSHVMKVFIENIKENEIVAYLRLKAE